MPRHGARGARRGEITFALIFSKKNGCKVSHQISFDLTG